VINEFLLFLQAIAFPIGRSVAGWAGTALKDNEVSDFEWKLLIETVIRVGMIEAAVYFSFNLAGVDIPIFAAGAAAFIADKIFNALKKNEDVLA